MVEQQEKIIHVAGEMFFRLGIRSVSIDDICRELGISKKTFYVYFESKDALIERLLQTNLEYISSKMADLAALRDFRQLVKLFLKRQQNEKNDVRRVPQLVYDLKKYYPRQFADFQERCFAIHKQYLVQYIQIGVEQGLVRANLNVEITALIFARIYSNAIRDFEELEAYNHNMHQLGHMALDILVRGILSKDGLELYDNQEIKI